jgi:hypothetical protein
VSGFYVEIILLPSGKVEQYANLPTFDEAIVWLDARNPRLNGRKGQFFGVTTDEQLRDPA